MNSSSCKETIEKRALIALSFISLHRIYFSEIYYDKTHLLTLDLPKALTAISS